MRFRAKGKELEAIKYGGTNKALLEKMHKKELKNGVVDED